MAIEDGLTGVTELRVHGVSGTPPDSILQMPHPWIAIVDGNESSGFFRRWMPGQDAVPTELGVRRVEAYSWGGLTSGPGLRALWLLALPFTLVDLGYWMLPVATTEDPKGRRLAAWVTRSVLRLFALTLTVTALAAVVLATMDVAAWQCGSETLCQDLNGLVGWLGHLARPQQRAAIAALVPGAFVLVLWTIGRSSLTKDSAPSPTVSADVLPLQHPDFFVTESSVVRLRRLHVTVAAALLAALVTVPLIRYHAEGPLDVIVLVVAIVLASAAVLIAIPERFVGRGGIDIPNMNGPTKFLQLASVGTLLVAIVLGLTLTTDPTPVPSHLPGLRALILAVFALQVLLVPLLFAGVGAQHPKRPVQIAAMALGIITIVTTAACVVWYVGRLADDQGSHPGAPPWPIITLLVLVVLALAVLPIATVGRTASSIAAGGLGGALVPTLAWLLALAFSVGVGLQTAQWLGHAVTSTALAATNTGPDAALIVPQSYIWAGAAAAVVALIAVALGLFVWFGLLQRRIRATEEDIATDYAELAGDEPPKRRRDRERIARGRALATLTDAAGLVVTVFVVTSVVVALAGSFAYVGWPDKTDRGLARFAAAAGSWVIVTALAGLVALGYASVRNRSKRRTIGILWDVATFWPRAVHPLTPPCYAERAVLDLNGRVLRLGAETDDVVVLSCHSQGSVIAVPTVLRLEGEDCQRLRLLLHGSPVRRLYGRWFPHYFRTEVFARLTEILEGRWRTLYRLTDPIGSWNIAADAQRAESYVAGETRVRDLAEVDQEVADPRLPGDGLIRGHSDYWLDPVYTATVAQLAALEQPPIADA
jgi:hypothetical protein